MNDANRARQRAAFSGVVRNEEAEVPKTRSWRDVPGALAPASADDDLFDEIDALVAAAAPETPSAPAPPPAGPLQASPELLAALEALVSTSQGAPTRGPSPPAGGTPPQQPSVLRSGGPDAVAAARLARLAASVAPEPEQVANDARRSDLAALAQGVLADAPTVLFDRRVGTPIELGPEGFDVVADRPTATPAVEATGAVEVQADRPSGARKLADLS